MILITDNGKFFSELFGIFADVAENECMDLIKDQNFDNDFPVVVHVRGVDILVTELIKGTYELEAIGISNDYN